MRNTSSGEAGCAMVMKNSCGQLQKVLCKKTLTRDVLLVEALAIKEELKLAK